MSPPPRLVVVEHDDWVLRLLADGLREGGFVVATATSAEEGFARVHEFSPDAILCDVGLPGIDGYSFATTIRGESIVPIALLAAQEDVGARTAAFEAGADALLVRPFRLEEVSAQMTALVQLARRMRERRTSLVDSLAAGPPSTTFKGDLAHMPVASLLMLLEIEKKSGTIEVRSNGQKAIFELASGWLVSTRLGGENNPATVLRAVLGWTEGRISFNASAPIPKPASARAVRVLLAEAGFAPTAEVAQSPSVARMPAMRPPPG
ncbi:MAG: response regulator, partial [Polyangiales bacterium]